MTSHAAAMHEAPAETGVGVYTQKLGMWIFLCSEVMFFTALIGSYIILRWGTDQGWPIPSKVLNVPLTALNTFILICSSVSMVKAFAAATHGDKRGIRLWLLLTVLGGATFVGIQVFEYIKLSSHGFLPSGFREGSEIMEKFVEAGLSTAGNGLFGSTFYTMTGFHGFHVTCGVVSMSYVTFQAFRGRYDEGRYQGIETIGLYWHFVDLVWIILFTIVYLF
jgi:heme/copper-type cytochrome/quinol oxidase subunit 3